MLKWAKYGKGWNFIAIRYNLYRCFFLGDETTTTVSSESSESSDSSKEPSSEEHHHSAEKSGHKIDKRSEHSTAGFK